MARVLIGWEFGAGLGHVAWALALAHGLAEAGHEPILALAHWAEPFDLLRDCPFAVVPAPHWDAAPRAGFRARSYDDILAARRYDDPAVLELVLRAWDQLLGAFQVDAAIAESSPSLVLACAGRLPLVQTACTFLLPPAHIDEFPVLDDRARSTTDRERLLDSIGTLLVRRGAPRPDSIPRAFAWGRRFACGLLELDPYAPLRRDPIGLMTPPMGPLPPANDRTFHAYLTGNYTGVEALLPYLRQRGMSGTAYFRNPSTECVQAARRAGVKVFDRPPPMAEILQRCRLVVHHGSHGTTCDALAAGRPQLALPTQLEQFLIAGRLEELGVGRRLGGRLFELEEVGDAASSLLDTGEVEARASALAEAISRRRPREILSSIVGALTEGAVSEQEASEASSLNAEYAHVPPRNA